MPSTGDIVRASDFEAVKPQLSIGTVTTGAAGTNASASVTGTTPNFKLNLTIPRGNTGATGATGPQGPSGVYTGPLKPTSDYYKVISVYPRSGSNVSTALTLPSGGTWAYYLISGKSTGSAATTTPGIIYTVDKKASVAAGGSVIGYGTSIKNNSDQEAKITAGTALIWRVQ